VHVLRQSVMPEGLLVTPPATAEVPTVTVRVCPPDGGAVPVPVS